MVSHSSVLSPGFGGERQTPWSYFQCFLGYDGHRANYTRLVITDMYRILVTDHNDTDISNDRLLARGNSKASVDGTRKAMMKTNDIVVPNVRSPVMR